MPMQQMPGDAGTFATIMFVHGWIVFHGVLYVIAGVLLLAGRYVPVALVILGPILVNILIFHFTLAPAGYAPGLVCALLEVFFDLGVLAGVSRDFLRRRWMWDRTTNDEENSRLLTGLSHPLRGTRWMGAWVTLSAENGEVGV